MNAQTTIQYVLHDLPSAATATFFALFPIVNPLGGIPVFFTLTGDFAPEERRRTALKTALYVIAILVTFMLFGRFVLKFFGIVKRTGTGQAFRGAANAQAECGADLA